MFNLIANINKRERIVRGTIGILLLFGLLSGTEKFFAFIIGLALIASAALSYCGLYELITRFKLDGDNTQESNDNLPK